MEIEGIELRTCPFCGSDDINLWSDIWTNEKSAHAMCWDCESQGPEIKMEDVGEKYEEIALHAWNCLGSLDDLLTLFGVHGKGGSNG